MTAYTFIILALIGFCIGAVAALIANALDRRPPKSE